MAKRRKKKLNKRVVILLGSIGLLVVVFVLAFSQLQENSPLFFGTGGLLI